MSRLFGDWFTVQPKLKVIADVITDDLVEELNELGWDFVEDVRNHIDNQDLGLPALSETTITKKGHANWWIDTGTFKDKLSVNKIRTGTKTATIRVGALQGKKYNNEVDMFTLAKHLEYGSSKIPARPLFKKSLELFKKDLDSFGEKTSRKIQLLWNS